MGKAEQAAEAFPALGPPFDDVDADEWGELLARGRESGGVHADDVAHVLRHVELTESVLTDVHTAMADHGIAIDEEVESVDDTPTSTPRQVEAEQDADEKLLSRRRTRRTRRLAPKGCLLYTSPSPRDS